MRDEDQRAAVIREKVLEPGDGVDVEMIGRLVEQQHIGFGDQRACQQHPPPPTARQGIDPRLGRQIETRQDQFDLVLAMPVFELVGARRIQAFGDDVVDRSRRGQRYVLDETSHLQAGLSPQRAGVWRQLAGQHLEQRRFAGAVSADDRNPLAGFNLQRDGIEQWQMAEGDGHTIENDYGHRSL